MSFFTETFAFITTLSTDLIVLAIVFAALFGLAIFSGKGKAVALFLAIYIGAILYDLLPFTSLKSSIVAQMLTFAAIIYLVQMALSSFVVLNFPYTNTSRMSQAAILALGTTGALILSGYKLLNLETLYSFSSPFIQAALVSSGYYFWWLLGSLAVFYFFLRK